MTLNRAIPREMDDTRRSMANSPLGSSTERPILGAAEKVMPAARLPTISDTCAPGPDYVAPVTERDPILGRHNAACAFRGLHDWAQAWRPAVGRALVSCSTAGSGVAKGALKLIAARLLTVSSSAVALSRLLTPYHWTA